MLNILEYLVNSNKTKESNKFNGFPVCKINNEYYAIINLENESEVNIIINMFNGTKYSGPYGIKYLINEKKKYTGLTGDFLVRILKVWGNGRLNTLTYKTIKLTDKKGSFSISSNNKYDYEIINDKINSVEDFEKYLNY